MKENESSRYMYKKLFEGAMEAIFVADAETGIIVECNDAACELVGRKKSELIGKHQRILHPSNEIGGDFGKTVDQYIREKEEQDLETKIATREGEIRNVVVKTNLLEHEGRKLVQGIFRDVTERKRIANELKNSKERLEIIFDYAPDAYYLNDLKGSFVDGNKAAEELTGYSRNELIGKSFLGLRLLSRGQIPKASKLLAMNALGKPTGPDEFVLNRRDNKQVTVEIRTFPVKVEGQTLVLGIARDITERKEAEIKLRESERRFREIFEKANDAFVYGDLKGRVLDLNQKAAELAGKRKDEIVGESFQKLGIVSLRDVPTLLNRLARKAIGKETEGFQLTITRGNGEKRVVEINSTLIRRNSLPVGFMAVVRDITERKKAELEILESQEKFKHLFMDNPEGAVYLDTDFRILDINPQFTKLVGYSLNEVRGKRINDLIVPDYKMKEAEILDGIARKGRVHHDTVRKKKDGTLIPVSVSAAPITVKGKPIGSIVLYQDITERMEMQKKLQEYSERLEELVEERTSQLKKAHAQLLRSERLAAIGELAAMVGHDLRNPLTGINTALYYLKAKHGPQMDEKAKEMVRLIEKDIDYSNKIISDLLDYAREAKPELTETTPRTIINEALLLVEKPENVRISVQTNDTPKMKADLEMMKRVMVNIIKNGLDSMPEGGKLTIRSREANGNIEIHIADTGTGISRDLLERIWDPLFTTKAKGMGLGLPICKRIIDAHGGEISVKSTLGKGTAFTVTLPTAIQPEQKGGEKAWIKAPESLLSTTTRV